MCDVSYAFLALSAISGAAQYDSQRKSANTQRDMIMDGVAKDNAATSRAYEQINAAAQSDQSQRHVEMLIDKARIMSIQAESGLQGTNYDRAQQLVEDNASADMAAIEQTRQWKAGDAAAQGAARQNQANIQMAGIRRPSRLGTGLQVAGEYAGHELDLYNERQKLKYRQQ